MVETPFIHLRMHSAYSLPEGAIRIKDLPKLCHDQAMPMPAVALLFAEIEKRRQMGLCQ